MPVNFPYGVTVEVWRATRARFGDVARAHHHDIAGCVLAPRYSTEATDNQNRVIVGFSLYGPFGADILADDRIRTPWDGNFYDVVGEAAGYQNPFTGWEAGVEAALQRVT
jgi:hypothetical protein